jgi:hypothetical protein
VPFCDTQVLITQDRSLIQKNGRNIFVIEITPRSRILAGRKRLTSNIGKDWSVDQLRKELLGRRVRFSGWLLFDAKYMDRSWSSDLEDTVGRPNARQSAWELHPVMGIEVLDPERVRTRRKRLSRQRD